MKLSLDHHVRARYGNPDLQILGTLKIKIQIYRFLNTPSKNMGSELIFSVAIYLEIAKLAKLWQPWKWNCIKNTKNMFKISYATQILQHIFKKLKKSFIVQDRYEMSQTYLAQWNFFSVS